MPNATSTGAAFSGAVKRNGRLPLGVRSRAECTASPPVHRERSAAHASTRGLTEVARRAALFSALLVGIVLTGCAAPSAPVAIPPVGKPSVVSSSSTPAPGVRVTISTGTSDTTLGQDTSTTVRLDNLSAQPIELVGVGHTYFNVTVTDSSGKLVSYSSANKPQLGRRGLLPQTVRLAPGAYLVENDSVRLPRAGTFLLRALLLQPSENPALSDGALPSLSVRAK